MKHQATKSPSDQLLATEWNAEHLLTEGLDASKPSSGLVARQLYWATDTKILYKAISATTWEELLRGEAVSRLAQLSEKSHANLTGVTASQHHTKTTSGEINLADLAEKAHGSLTGVTADQHHTQDHASRHVDGGADEITSKLDFRAINIMQVKATATTTFSTTSTTFVDVTGLSVNINLPQTGVILVSCSAYAIRNSGGSVFGTCQQLVRNSTVIRNTLITGGDNDSWNGLITTLDVNVAAGSHTYKLQGRVGTDGTSYWDMHATAGQQGEIFVIAFKY